MDNVSFLIRKYVVGDPTMADVICMLTRSPYHHVETLLNGRYFSVTPSEGVRFLDLLDHADDPAYWMWLDTSIQCTELLIASCEAKVGESYDYYGAFLSGLRVQDPSVSYRRTAGREWCSMCGQEAAENLGIPGLDQMPCPAVFASNIAAYLGVCCDVQPVAGLAFADRHFQFIQDLVDDARNPLDPGVAQQVIAACQGGQP